LQKILSTWRNFRRRSLQDKKNVTDTLVMENNFLNINISQNIYILFATGIIVIILD